MSELKIKTVEDSKTEGFTPSFQQTHEQCRKIIRWTASHVDR